MGDTRQQSYASHARRQPVYHFVLIPILITNLVITIVWAVQRPGFHRIWTVVLSFALLLMGFLVRVNSNKVQDRVIRLEERLRLAALLPDSLRLRIPELTESQLIGLRFASDAELPALAQRALDEKLDRKAIKQAIQQWRPDHFRA